MYKINLSILKSDSKALSYLKEKLCNSFTTTITEYLTRTVLTVENASPKLLRKIVSSIVVDVVISYYKLNYISKQLSRKITPEIACLLGAVVAFRQDEERAIISEKIVKLDDVNFDGLLNFRLTDLINEWTELGKLTSRLLSQCYCDQDVYQLIAFMIGLEETKKQEITLNEDLSLNVENQSISVYPFFDDLETSILYSMLIVRPSSIIIKSPRKIDGKIVNCVKNLGK